jgi:hypothetical protein
MTGTTTIRTTSDHEAMLWAEVDDLTGAGPAVRAGPTRWPAQRG